MRRNAIAMLIESLRIILAGPKNVNREIRLLVSINPPLVSIVDMGARTHKGVLVSLGSIFEQVDRCLGYDMPDIMAHQYDLNLANNHCKARKTNGRLSLCRIALCVAPSSSFWYGGAMTANSNAI